MKDHTYTPNMPDDNGWKRRHLEAMAEPCGTLQAGVFPAGNDKYTSRLSGERGLVLMLRGWLEYAEAHRYTYESQIGDDRVLGDEWMAIGQAMLGLLNGDLGRLDGGTLDAIIRDNLNEQGFDPEIGERKRDI